MLHLASIFKEQYLPLTHLTTFFKARFSFWYDQKFFNYRYSNNRDFYCLKFYSYIISNKKSRLCSLITFLIENNFFTSHFNNDFCYSTDLIYTVSCCWLIYQQCLSGWPYHLYTISLFTLFSSLYYNIVIQPTCIMVLKQFIIFLIVPCCDFCFSQSIISVFFLV